MSDNIFQRMSAITADISAVAKNLEVGFGSSKYKAVGEADVLAAVKPLEAKHGVYSYPISRDIVESGVYENDKGKKMLYLRIKARYRFLCIDNPESYLDIESFADGVDTQDKAPGKAMTYADKYALLKAYKIITGDDPDQNYSDNLGKVTKAEQRQMNTKPTPIMVDALRQRCNNAGVPVEDLCKLYKVGKLEDMDMQLYNNVVQFWDKVVDMLATVK